MNGFVRGFDPAAYLRAFALLARHPQIALAPLLAAVAEILLYKVVPADGGFLGFANTTLVTIISQLLVSFGLAVAVIGGEEAWRYGKAPFEDAYVQARRRASDIFIAAIGYSFLISMAGLVGGVFGPNGSETLTVAASVLCVYMIPAAAIGGIPGGASLNVSVERVRNAPLAAIVVAIVFFVSVNIVPYLIVLELAPFLLNATFFGADDVTSLVVALAKGIMWGYVGVVLAKIYGDASFGRFRSS